MKYSIGDIVMVKYTAEKGKVVDRGPSGYRVWFRGEYTWRYYFENELLTDLSAIKKPFWLLSRKVQEELQAVNNGKNIQFYSPGDGWVGESSPTWDSQDSHRTYRLSPKCKQQEVKNQREATPKEAHYIMHAYDADRKRLVDIELQAASERDAIAKAKGLVERQVYIVEKVTTEGLQEGK